MSKLIVITAPSGAGKTTIVNHLISKFDKLSFSVSATTRAPRPGEQDGVDYYFLSWDEFEQKVQSRDFIEWELIYPGQRSGTLISEVERIADEGKYVLFDIEVKGAVNIKKMYPEALVIFVKPPSAEVLFERLRKRQTETEDSLKQRIKRAKMELSYEGHFDRVLVNDDLETTLTEAEQIIGDFINV